MNRKLDLCVFPLLAAAVIAAFASEAPAQLYINEIYFNPPGALDISREYIELRGLPGMSLTNHYLILIENADNAFHTLPAGVIDHIFNLNGKSLGSNGFLTLRQKNSPYAVASDTADFVNCSSCGDGFGAGNAGATSSIGASDQNNLGAGNGEIESGFTAMLIRNNGPLNRAPALNQDLDVGNNGLDSTANDVNDWRTHWTILDSIGFTEPGEAPTARYYGMINFGTEMPEVFDPSDQMEPGATYVGLGFESEYAARWGNSTGQTAADWHVSDLTDNAASGYQTGTSNFRQSGNVHPANDGNANTPPTQPTQVHSTQGGPYGTILTNTLGAPNFLLGDYNKDGVVNSADYVVWQKTLGQTGSDTVVRPADGNNSYAVDQADHTVWQAHFGQPGSGGSGGSGSFSDPLSFAVPEPAAWVLAALVSFALPPLRKRRRA